MYPPFPNLVQDSYQVCAATLVLAILGIEGELGPLHVLLVATMGVTGEAWVFLDDPLGVLTWGHAAVVPWQGAVRDV